MKIARLFFWAALLFLVILGVTAAVERGLRLREDINNPGKYDSRLFERDEQRLLGLASVIHLSPRSKRYKDAEADVIAFSVNYRRHIFATLLHIAGGASLLIFAPLQFSGRIRSKHIQFHRWLGRILLIIAVVIGLSAFFFGLLMPFGGAGEALAAITFGGLFLFSAGKAFSAIRHGDITKHREWMLRMFAVAIGVSVVRVVNFALAFLTTARPRELFDPSLWIGWILTLTVTELWIRKNHHKGTELTK
jgi:uncharacterized membrane protein